ncbi:hypothetical protein ACIP5U_11095, partial [Streptomyces sp. NPDC088788]|uniref:hypothetical protein n=1 Tax=Streptomyces sp. NPDC088788 TaxID=3365898 RepID=UPI0037F20205
MTHGEANHLEGSPNPFELGLLEDQLVTLELLEVLTKVLDVPVGDQAGGEAEESLVDVVASF